MLTWGGSWVSGKLLSHASAIWNMAFWRFLLTFLSYLPLALIWKQPLVIPSQSIKPVYTDLIISVIGLVCYNIFFFLAVETGLAGKGGVIAASLNPLFGFVIAVVFQKMKPKPLQIGGLMLGLAGMLILLEVGTLGGGDIIRSGSLLFAGAGLSWAVLTFGSGRAQRHIPVITYSIALYFIVTILALAASLLTGSLGFRGFGGFYWLNIFYLSVVVGTLGTTLYFISAKAIGSARTGSFTFLVPLFAIFLSWLILGEAPHITSLIGGACALSAVYLINYKNRSI